MTESNRRKSRLVADKRYPTKGRKPAATKRAAKPAGKKSTARKAAPRKTARKKTRRSSGGKGGGIFRRLFRWLWRIIWGITWRVGAVAGLLLALAVGVVYTSLPDVDALLDGRARGSVTLLDRDGKVFAWRGDQFGGVITADTVSPHLKNAVIATEDKRFYRHFGVSPRGVASAVRINLSEGRGPLSGHGGSTITQQTAKLLCLGVPYEPSEWESEAAYEADCRQGSLWRKAKEAVYAIAMEVKYSKDEILTIYLNRAFLGAGARGFEAASQRYFGISAAEVSPAEAAMMRLPVAVDPTLPPKIYVLWDICGQLYASILLDHDVDTKEISITERYAARCLFIGLSNLHRSRVGQRGDNTTFALGSHPCRMGGDQNIKRANKEHR